MIAKSVLVFKQIWKKSNNIKQNTLSPVLHHRSARERERERGREKERREETV